MSKSIIDAAGAVGRGEVVSPTLANKIIQGMNVGDWMIYYRGRVDHDRVGAGDTARKVDALAQYMLSQSVGPHGAIRYCSELVVRGVNRGTLIQRKPPQKQAFSETVYEYIFVKTNSGGE